MNPKNRVDEDAVSMEILPELRRLSQENMGRLGGNCRSIIRAVYHVSVLDAKRYIRLAKIDDMNKGMEDKFRESIGGLTFLVEESGRPFGFVKALLDKRRTNKQSRIHKYIH